MDLGTSSHTVLQYLGFLSMLPTKAAAAEKAATNKAARSCSDSPSGALAWLSDSAAVQTHCHEARCAILRQIADGGFARNNAAGAAAAVA